MLTKEEAIRLPYGIGVVYTTDMKSMSYKVHALFLGLTEQKQKLKVKLVTQNGALTHANVDNYGKTWCIVRVVERNISKSEEEKKTC